MIVFDFGLILFWSKTKFSNTKECLRRQYGVCEVVTIHHCIRLWYGKRKLTKSSCNCLFLLSWFKFYCVYVLLCVCLLISLKCNAIKQTPRRSIECKHRQPIFGGNLITPKNLSVQRSKTLAFAKSKKKQQQQSKLNEMLRHHRLYVIWCENSN